MIYDENGNAIENPDLTLGYETRQVYVPYTDGELERMADAAERAQREEWLSSAPSQLADMDELLVTLYESQLETDEALCALYEGGI